MKEVQDAQAQVTMAESPLCALQSHVRQPMPAKPHVAGVFSEADMQQTGAVASVPTVQGENQPMTHSSDRVVPLTTERQDGKRPPSPQIEERIEVGLECAQQHADWHSC